MRVFVTGATGVLGRRLVADLADRGHEVVGLARDDEGERLVAERGGRPFRGDLFDADSLAEGAEDADAIVHLATALPTETGTSAEDWERNDRVRLDGARASLAAADRAGVDHVLTHGVVWAYRNDDGSAIDEGAEPNTDRTTASAVELESLFDDADVATTVLRYGWLYGPESGQFRTMARNVLSGDLPVVGDGLLGRGDTTVSLLHTADAARAMAEAVEREATGVYHVVDDEPVTTADFFAEFADLLAADDPGRVPGWLAKFFVGGDMVRFLTNDFPADAERFRREVGWEPTYPTYREGLAATVQSWLDDGTLVVDGDGYAWASEVTTHYECRECGRHYAANDRTCPNCDATNERPVSS